MPQTSPLDGRELAHLHEIVGSPDYTLADVTDLASLLSDDQLDILRNYFEAWEPLRGKDMRFSGGRMGLDKDPDRNRRRISGKVREILGIAGAGSSGLFNISVGGR